MKKMERKIYEWNIKGRTKPQSQNKIDQNARVKKIEINNLIPK